MCTRRETERCFVYDMTDQREIGMSEQLLPLHER